MKDKTCNRHVGWDCFNTKPDQHEEMYCLVCDCKMAVKRNVEGATSWGESMIGQKHLHDSFYCKNSCKDWHKQVLALKQRIEVEPSQKITELLESEIQEILETKKTTKKLNWRYEI